MSFFEHPLPLKTPLALLLTLVPALAADLPVPQLLVRPGPVTDGSLALAVPAGTVAQVEGGVTEESGRLVFGGDGATITIPFDAATLFGAPFTVAARIEPQAIRGYANIVDAHQPFGFCLLIHHQGRYSVSGGGAAQWNKVGAAPKSVQTGAVQNIAVTCDGTEVVIYVDGQESGRGEFIAVPQAKDTIVLGSKGRTTDGGEVVDVPAYRLEEVAIFDSVLTPEQIQSLASGASPPVN